MHMYLVRHCDKTGKVENDLGQLVEGGLSELGHMQGRALMAIVPKYISVVNALYSSTMRRARDTAEYIANACHAQIKLDARVREFGFNRSDGEAWPDNDLPPYAEDFSGSREPFTPIPTRENQESWMDFRVRVGKFVEELIIEHQGQTVIVVCHARVINATFEHVFDMGARRHACVYAKEASFTHFEHQGDDASVPWMLHSFNFVEHLGHLRQP